MPIDFDSMTEEQGRVYCLLKDYGDACVEFGEVLMPIAGLRFYTKAEEAREAVWAEIMRIINERDQHGN